MSRPRPRVVVVDDDPDDRTLVLRELARSFPEADVEQAGTPEQLDELLRRPRVDVLVTDYHLRWATGLDVFARVREAAPECRGIMYTGTGTEEVAVAAMKAGLDDYIVKSPWHLTRVGVAVRAAWERQSERRALSAAERDLREKMEALQSLSDDLARSNARLRDAVELAEEARAASETANRAKSDFLATMSHELRTPLNAVIGYLELLEIGVSGPLTDAQRGHLDRIRSSSEHLLALIEDVLDITRIESSRLSVYPQLAPAEDVVESALAMVRPRADAQSLVLVVGPEHDRSTPLYADVDRARQILANLLGNAVKFTPPGGRVTVEFGRQAEGLPLHGGPAPAPRSWIRVRDTGIGIPAEQLERIFDPFVQVETGHTRTHSGVGLGLAISQRLARIMNGDIEVASAPGEGSAFTLWLPGSRPEMESTGPAGEALSIPEAPPAWTSGLAELGRALGDRVGEITVELVDALRRDPSVPTESRRYSELADHHTTLVADILTTLIVLDEFSGGPTRILSDGLEIQRSILSHHVHQRLELGWSEAAVRREFTVLRQVMRAAVHQVATSDPAVREQAVTIIDRILEQAAYLSAQSYRQLKQTS